MKSKCKFKIVHEKDKSEVTVEATNVANAMHKYRKLTGNPNYGTVQTKDNRLKYRNYIVERVTG